MNTCLIPQGYRPPLCGYDMQRAIEFVKSSFQENLKFALNLRRVSAPLFVDRDSGLNDNLNGVERPVGFDIPAIGGAAGEVVHSLAKWKRLALKRYGFYPGNGLYTDMNAIRRDESLDNIHSVYVDQWDWEKVITRADRNVDFLQYTVRSIVGAVCDTCDALRRAFPQVKIRLDREVSFITTQELEDMYPHLPPQERENPSLLNSSRKKRIAAGCGLQVVDVNRLLKQFEMLQALTRQFSGGKMPKNMRKMMGKKGRGMPGMPF